MQKITDWKTELPEVKENVIYVQINTKMYTIDYIAKKKMLFGTENSSITTKLWPTDRNVLTRLLTTEYFTFKENVICERHYFHH